MFSLNMAIKNKEIKKIRVFCPQDQYGFTADKEPNIFCRQGNHSLSSEFPPYKDFWAYCCGCQRYYPLHIHNNENEIRYNCASCERKILNHFLCVKCNTISVDLEKGSLGKKYHINFDNNVTPNCPSCEVISETDKIKLHNCENLGISFYTARTICPFCSEQTDKYKQTHTTDFSPEIVYEDTSSAPEVHERPVFPDAEHANQVVKLEDSSEISNNETAQKPILYVDETINLDSPPILEDTSQSAVKNQSDSSNFPNVGGCFVFVLIGIVVLSCIFIGRNNPPESLSNSSNTNNSKIFLANSNTPISQTPEKSPQLKTFHNNSKVISDESELKSSPEPDGEVITLLSSDTLVRVIDRKTPNSSWYKVKTENGEEGWIHGNYIEAVDWASLPCEEGDIGYISGGNLRSSPVRSADDNIKAVWDKGSKIKILSMERGEPGLKTGNPYWYKIRVLEGSCSFPVGNNNYSTYNSCEVENEGYMNSSLIDCD